MSAATIKTIGTALEDIKAGDAADLYTDARGYSYLKKATFAESESPLMKKSILLDGGLPLKPARSLFGLLIACCTAMWIAPCAIIVCLLRPKEAQRIGTAFIAVIEAVKST